jgi:hypothetical protein
MTSNEVDQIEALQTPVECQLEVSEARRLEARDKTMMQSPRSGVGLVREATCAFTYWRISKVLLLLPSHEFVLQLRLEVRLFHRGFFHLNQWGQWW